MRVRKQTKTHSIYNALRSEIEEGIWKVGDKMPSDLDLSTRFGCSVGTVNRSMTSLAHEGWIDRRMRTGSRVIRREEGDNEQSLQLDAVACIFSSKRHEGIWRMVQGFQHAADAVERRVMMLGTGTDFRKEAEIVGRLSEFDVKGALLIPTICNPQDQLYYSQMIAACKFPIVVADFSLMGLGASHVCYDAFHAGRGATQHLLEKGARRIGFAANNFVAPLMRDFYQGYLCALADAEIEEQSAYVQRDQYMRSNLDDPFAESKLMVRSLLEKHPEIDGIVCGSDFTAIACIEVAREMGISVPNDLMVTGADDFTIASTSHPALTTYHIPFEEIGRQSFSLLNRMLLGESFPGEEIRVKGHLVVRGSTGG